MTEHAAQEPDGDGHRATGARLSRRVWVVTSLSVVVAFGIGLVVGWQALGNSDSSRTAIEQTCALADDLPSDLVSTMKQAESSRSFMVRVTAVADLASAAAIADDLNELEGLSHDLRSAVSRVDVQRAANALAQVRAYCDEHGP